MSGRAYPIGGGRGFSAAARRFPAAEFAIRRLMSQSADFSEMCEELAEAERALLSVQDMPTELQDARRAEWQGLVDRLVAEVGTALQESEARHGREGRRPSGMSSS